MEASAGLANGRYLPEGRAAFPAGSARRQARAVVDRTRWTTEELMTGMEERRMLAVDGGAKKVAPGGRLDMSDGRAMTRD